jgi:hypothetical protein
VDFASLPTDNLYKFIALAGLAIQFFSLYFSIVQLDKLEGKIEDAELESALMELESTHIESEVSRLEQIAEPSRDDVKAARERTNELGRRSIRLKGNLKSTKRLLKRAKDLRFLLLGGAIFGLGLTVMGFSLWYYRLQRYQDRAAQVSHP